MKKHASAGANAAQLGHLITAPQAGHVNDPGQPSGFASELAGRPMRAYPAAFSAEKSRGGAGAAPRGKRQRCRDAHCHGPSGPTGRERPKVGG